MTKPQVTKTALIIAAHPDDEVLGVGGTAARLVINGWQVHSLIVAEGATSRQGLDPNSQNRSNVASLAQSAEHAAMALGLTSTSLLGFPDNRLDGIDLLDIVYSIEAAISDLQPSTVYTHHSGDLNIDHRCVHQAVLTACRPLPGTVTRNIYAFETVSSTEWAITPNIFRPTHFVDISATLSQKIAALSCYKDEMREYPHPRSIKAIQHLAYLRGSQCGLESAEAFEVIRQIHSGN